MPACMQAPARGELWHATCSRRAALRRRPRGAAAAGDAGRGVPAAGAQRARPRARRVVCGHAAGARACADRARRGALHGGAGGAPAARAAGCVRRLRAGAPHRAARLGAVLGAPARGRVARRRARQQLAAAGGAPGGAARGGPAHGRRGAPAGGGAAAGGRLLLAGLGHVPHLARPAFRGRFGPFQAMGRVPGSDMGAQHMLQVACCHRILTRRPYLA